MGPQSSAETGAQQGERLTLPLLMLWAEHLTCPAPSPPSDPVQPGEDHPEGGAGEVRDSAAQEDPLAAGPQSAHW